MAAFALLTEGASDPASVWRTPSLATIGLDGSPKLRTVVLRAFDPLARCLDIHTDGRSAKHAELRRQPDIQLHGWDAARRIQLRLSGRASLHTGDGLAASSWRTLPPPSRATYGVQPGPGTKLAHPDDAHPGPDDGQAVFCVIRVSLAELEWLHLAETGHRRALFRWDPREENPMWLVP